MNVYDAKSQKQNKKKPMTKQKTKKTIFAVINLGVPTQEQVCVATYAAKLSDYLDYDLVLYPQQSKHTSFEAAILEVKSIAKYLKTTGTISVSKEKITLFNLKSINSIAKKAHAEMIVIGIERGTENFLGESIWNLTQKTLVPIMLLPYDIVFKPYETIVMSLDSTLKIQKTSLVVRLAKAFTAKINIFQENLGNESFKMTPTINHVEKIMRIYGIYFKVEKARKNTNFPKHLCKYAAKYGDLLAIEVDPGKIDTIIKQNIETLLTISNGSQPVLFVKTKETGLMNYR
ncbi:MAG: hypothetical protein WCH65_08560 [bacterium]